MNVFKLALCAVVIVTTTADNVASVTTAERCTSEPYELSESFKVGTTTVTSIYLCHNGYITVAGESVNLENPDDLLDSPTTVIAAGLIDSNDSNVAVLETVDNTNYFRNAVPCFTYGYEIGASWEMSDGNRRAVFIACGTDDMAGKRCLFEVEIQSLTHVLDENGQFMRFGINGPDITLWEMEGSGTANVTLLASTNNNDDTHTWLFELDQSGSSNPIMTLNPDSFCADFPTGVDAGDALNPLITGACSDPVQLRDDVVKIFGLEFNKVCICNDGYVVLDCETGSTDPITPSDFDDLTEYIIAPALIQNKFDTTKRQKRDLDDAQVSYRRMSESDLFAAKFKLQDPNFDASFGYVATWYHVGDLVNDNVNTNTFQLGVVCDNDYDGTERQRCVAIIVYHEMGYTQNAAAEQLIAGINGPGNNINYNLIPDDIAPENISMYLTADNGLFLLDLREHLTNDVTAVAEFDRNKFTSDVEKLRPQMVSCVALIIGMAFVKVTA